MRRSGAVWVVVAGFLLGLSGCDRETAPPVAEQPTYTGVELTVGVLGDPALRRLIESQKGEWEETRGGSIRLETEPLPPPSLGQLDVILFPGQSLGQLVDLGLLGDLPRALTDAPEAPAPPPGDPEATTASPPDDPIEFGRVFPPFRDEAGHYGEARLGLPIGGSALVLAYRKSALSEAPDSLKDAAKSAGIALEAPATWEALEQLARFLHGRDLDGDGQPEAGISLALGQDDAEEVALSILLARAAAGGLHRDYFSFLMSTDTLEPWIDLPPFVEALAGLAALASSAPEGAAGFNAEQARIAFRDGKAALLIDRADRVRQWVAEGDQAAIGVAPLPGSSKVFDPDRKAWDEKEQGEVNRPTYLPARNCWLVGVSAKSPNAEAARDFARYLIESETAARIREDRDLPLLPIRSDLIGQGPPAARDIAAVDRRAWSDALSATFLAPKVVIGLRIPEAEGYMADLDRARLEAVGGADPAAALRMAAEAWRARTARLGQDRQLWHYRRSLLHFATSPEPPARP
jgi:multiple sugar transport system substrate-binding protein